MAQSSGSGSSGSAQNAQVERVLRWILVTILIGLLAIALLALGQPEVVRGSFFGNGALAAGMALAAGAALGLLFGLPWRTDRVVVAAAPATGGAGPQNAADSSAAHAAQVPDSWYKDNTSLEQIAQWLTTSIVALTLVNFDGWVKRFERAAEEVTCAMYGSPPANCGLVPGGVIMALYATLGLLAGYLWARRYLMAELSRGIVEDQQARRDAEQTLTLARANQLVQSQDSEELPAAEQLTERVEANAPLEKAPAISPGTVPDDPWKGQFGGQPFNDKVLASATVTPLASKPGCYSIRLLIRAVDNNVRPIVADKRARLYLHPTFVDAIRVVRFDFTGQLDIPLVAYGAFTVGVQLWDDSRIELDLSQLPDAPAEFRAG